MVKEVMTGTYTKGEKDYNFKFYTDLTMAEKVGFVNSIVNSVVDEDYNSLLRDLLFDFFISVYFVDKDSKVYEDVYYILKQSPKFVDDAEGFLEETNIVDIVKANMADGLLDELNDAVNKNIEFKTGIHTSPFDDLSKALTGLVNTLEEKLNEINTDELMGMAKTFGDMTGDITPESIMSAYMDSDIFKKNVEEVKESKDRAKLTEFANDMDKAIRETKGSKLNNDKVVEFKDKK